MHTPNISSLGGVLRSTPLDFLIYSLENGLDIILYPDHNIPVVVTSIMYHVGSKDDPKNRRGFAHFFEHLLFEGTENIARGEWFKLVSANGGNNNANTSDDRTYYYEVFPSHQLELSLWMESERLRHAVINQIGVDTQKEVVKEEKKMRYDNRPYGQLLAQVKKHLFPTHPYQNTTIGEIEDINASSLIEFQNFYKKYYTPNNAVLVVAGNFETEQTKKWIQKYFGSITPTSKIERERIFEKPITNTLFAEYEDPNIQIPMLVLAYRTPSMKEKESRILDFISSYLSDGQSSKLYKNLVDEKKMALQVGAFNISLEEYGLYIIYALPMTGVDLNDLKTEIDEAIQHLQQELISDHDFLKLKNKYENHLVDNKTNLETIAHDLASFHLLYKDVNLINTESDLLNSINQHEIQLASQNYLNKNQRLELIYKPKNIL
ncbi:M16 family metallopeptidase [Flavobacterium oreochromis]|uniref:Peptidase M16 n=2 Tax=Flavobacterium TaxID=237 RepID=A0A246GCI7_9FLAO|nr:pitrilysin family protein [Flavobacterium oreochromis]OWP78182.1 peptidase M16 [Flavobacterium oreochromis]OWP78822.1 peptidase M16 [Flavobacterium oreochromis]POR26783.1 peptidase M16 [Flavobacterium columnare]